MSEEVENEEGGALLTLDSIEWPIYPDYVYKFETNSTNTGRGLIFKLTNELVKKRLRSYSRSGMRTTVCGLIMCHSQGVPHVLLLKREEDGCYGLLGGKCKIYENPREKLSHKLARFITCNTRHANLYDIKSSIENIKVKEFLADWWRCDYHTDPLPFLPLHTSRPKEKISIYQVCTPLIYQIFRLY
ncbi:mRNA cleavage factor-like protein, putative [Theileria equi strain WA]|uniref:mRNA cleavage factor-like protein, putative n=1 Tax=Theileria equi strain WA TaxID=1537102 RepID=L0B098_THEEQ|nr:mRNA cleavage factor-like protein, putative [Theileria equi strain WA]AFZ81282.1 mRNA cleavage factor-like protein, putative [Theileria equi strain WA]|eukprot:XP_004830948.1 mRNA cleavage factor-like protein, putative [Theileria equi strain WA]